MILRLPFWFFSDADSREFVARNALATRRMIAVDAVAVHACVEFAAGLVT
jgi:hypothetical protein